jgi:predicted patatin/cPLA2 family phospholipase
MDKENIFYSNCLKGWLLTRLEKDKSKLVKLYDMGVRDMKALMPSLMEFLEK